MRFHDATETWLPADLRSAVVSPAVSAAYETETVATVAQNTAAANADFFAVSEYLEKSMVEKVT